MHIYGCMAMLACSMLCWGIAYVVALGHAYVWRWAILVHSMCMALWLHDFEWLDTLSYRNKLMCGKDRLNDML